MPTEEQSLAADLLAGVENATLTDVALVGSDDGSVPASRFILAARSRVFERMLYGNFKESASTVVRLDYDSDILSALVEYCCSDGVKSFETRNGEADEVVARKLVQLCSAAHFFDMPNLAALAERRVEVLLEESPCLSCAVYDQVGADTMMDHLKSCAKKMITSRPGHSLLHPDDSESGGGVASLGPASLRELVKDKALAGLEGKTLFRALVSWAKKDSGTQLCYGDERERRTAIAKRCAFDIDLSVIDPVDLLGIVLESGLVEMELIFEALKKQIGEDVFYVRGAGTCAVNGRYEKYGANTESGDPMYRKRGLWEGEVVWFYLYRLRGFSGVRHTRWYISLPPKEEDELTQTCEDRDFYMCRDLIIDSDLEDNWRAVELGIEPPPTCGRFIWQGNEDI